MSHFWPWVHHWKVISAKPMEMRSWPRWDIPSDVTVVLYGCACGARTTETIEGHWTIGELSEANE